MSLSSRRASRASGAAVAESLSPYDDDSHPESFVTANKISPTGEDWNETPSSTTGHRKYPPSRLTNLRASVQDGIKTDGIDYIHVQKSGLAGNDEVGTIDKKGFHTERVYGCRKPVESLGENASVPATPSHTRDEVGSLQEFDTVALSDSPVFKFDDENAEYLSSDSDLAWGNRPFDYEVPFETPLIQEGYPFENQSQISLWSSNLANQRIPGAGTARRVGDAAVNQALNVCERLTETCNIATNQMERVVQAGRNIVTTGALVAVPSPSETSRVQEYTTASRRRRFLANLPVLGNRWIGRTGTAIRNGIKAIPPVEQYTILGKGGRRRGL